MKILDHLFDLIPAMLLIALVMAVAGVPPVS